MKKVIILILWTFCFTYVMAQKKLLQVLLQMSPVSMSLERVLWKSVLLMVQ